MTKELAKNILAEHIKLMEQENEPSLKEDIDALTLAIQALSQEPCTDAVSRQAVKEQINCWVGSGEYRYAMSERFLIDRINDLLSVTPKPIECDDAISREMVNTLVDELARAISDERCHIPQRGRDTGHIMHDILDLPSVTQKLGKWIKMDEGFSPYECSICGSVDFKDSKYCPNCGARMVEPQESEEQTE